MKAKRGHEDEVLIWSYFLVLFKKKKKEREQERSLECVQTKKRPCKKTEVNYVQPKAGTLPEQSTLAT